MGMSVSAHTYSIKKLKENLEKSAKNSKAKISPSKFLDKAMEVAGDVNGDIFTTVSCDYWNEYDPWSSLITAIEAYYKIDNGYEILSDAQICWVYQGCDTSEIYEALELDEYPTHPDEEEEED